MHNYSPESVSRFRGTGVALVTPFSENDAIDFPSLDTLIEHCIGGGVEFLVSMGTTGESATLSEQERFDIISHTIRSTKKRVPVVAGFGGNNTAELIQSIQRYTDQYKNTDTFADAILISSPFYNKPTQEGIYRHYTAIDAISPLPIILYNVPGRTASNMEAKTTLRIAQDAQHVIAIKEASGNFAQCMHIIRDAPKNFLVLSGDDPITLPFIATGMQGVISVVANAWPQQFSTMVRHCLANDFAKANPAHLNLLHVTELLFKEGSPAGVKSALHAMGICGEKVRLPLWKISDALRAEITQEVKRLGS